MIPDIISYTDNQGNDNDTNSNTNTNTAQKTSKKKKKKKPSEEDYSYPSNNNNTNADVFEIESFDRILLDPPCSGMYVCIYIVINIVQYKFLHSFFSYV